MELKDTVSLMLSDDYLERMKAEYYQAKNRCENLERYLAKQAAIWIDEGYFGERLIGNVPVEILQEQLRVMKEYIHILSVRLELAGTSY